MEILSLLHRILNEDRMDMMETERKTKAYDTLNWSAIQAHRNGEIAGYSRVMSLIDFAKDTDL